MSKRPNRYLTTALRAWVHRADDEQAKSSKWSDRERSEHSRRNAERGKREGTGWGTNTLFPVRGKR